MHMHMHMHVHMCQVLFEREGFCNTGRFAQLRTMRSAVLPAAALLNLSRPPLTRGHAAAVAAAAAGLRGAGGGGAAALGKRYEGAPSNMFLLLDAEYLQVGSYGHIGRMVHARR